MSSSHLPSHWTTTTLEHIVTALEAGKSFRCIEKPPIGEEPGVVKVSAVSWGSFNEQESKTCPSEIQYNPSYQIHPGDLLISRANSIELVGACVIVGSVSKRLMLSDKILRVLAADELKPWILWYLRCRDGRDQIEAYSTGNQLSMRNIGQASILKIRIPLAPDRERLQVIEAIESYLTRLDDAMANLERVQRNLKRYRASVLKAAVEGRLVPTEAELARAEGREYEPASVLLERILAERRRRWEEAELTKMKAKGKEPKNDKWKAKYVQPAASETSDLPELPEGWCWTTWSQIGISQNGRPFPSNQYCKNGVRLLRPGNLHASGRIEWNQRNTRCMPAAWENEFPQFLVGGNELVINLTAQSLKDEFLGRVCMTGAGDRCLLNQRIGRLTPIIISARFVLWWLKSPIFRGYVDGLNKGSLIQHMFTSQLDLFTFPLPPLAEQARIVGEIERLIGVQELVENDVQQSMFRIPRLRQAVLSWAFEGRLVDQDPSDEPAAVLLERIRAERAAGKGKKQPRTRRVNTRTAST